MTKCEATNDETGAACLFTQHSPNVRHLWADDKYRNNFDLGKLQGAVRAFLAGAPAADRDFLARILAETEEGR